MNFSVLLVVILFFDLIYGQINLGTFNLNRNPAGDLELGFGQGANVFGFGGDRAFMVTVGPGKFDTRVDGGALIGGERLGLDGRIGVKENQALKLDSNIKFGNAPPNPSDPAGQLNTFINNIGHFFQRFMPSPSSLGPPPESGGLVPRQRPAIEVEPVVPTLIPEIEETTIPFDYEIFTATKNKFEKEDFSEEKKIVDSLEKLTNSGEARSKITTEGRFSKNSNEEKQGELKRNRPYPPDGLIEFKQKSTKNNK